MQDRREMIAALEANGCRQVAQVVSHVQLNIPKNRGE
jgi:predicted RNA binding protein YcfA (HicA-like mRNA interferase family)